MNKPTNRAKDWLKQAENDFEWAEESVKLKRYAQTCFICQQAAEKAMKSIALHRGIDEVRGHSIKEIAKSIGINSKIESAAKRLDLYYISSRYPDAFSSGAPYEYFTEEQAVEAIGLSRLILNTAQSEVNITDGK